MKRIFTLLIMLVMVFGLTVTAYANAWYQILEPVPGEFVVLDKDTNLMWLQNTNLAGTAMNWTDAMDWASTLSYAGYDDWGLPSALNSDGSGPCSGHSCSDSEIGHLYYIEGVTSSSPTPFTNLSNDRYWTSTEDGAGGSAWYFYFYNGNQNPYVKSSNYRAWAVRVVPEPISSILFITGGATLAVRRYCKRRK